jgi:hypothetical protein
MIHICCIFAACFLHIYCIFLAYNCIFELPKVHILHILCIFLHIYSILCPLPGFSARAPGPPRSAWHANGSPGDPPVPLDPSRSKHAASNLGTTTPPAPLKASSVNTELWNVVVVAYIQHMQTKSSDTRSCKKLFQTNVGREQIGRLALSMTSPMDARGHYQWLHLWTPKRDWDNVWQQIGLLAL